MKRKTVLHQIKTKGITLDGMSYVIQAEDGSLIVIDGGMNEDADDLFAYLQRLCGGDKVTVDLWIITHAHADHYNCFMTQCPGNGSSVGCMHFIQESVFLCMGIL